MYKHIPTILILVLLSFLTWCNLEQEKIYLELVEVFRVENSFLKEVHELDEEIILTQGFFIEDLLANPEDLSTIRIYQLLLKQNLESLIVYLEEDGSEDVIPVNTLLEYIKHELQKTNKDR